MRLLNYIFATIVAAMLPSSMSADDMLSENHIWNYVIEHTGYGLTESVTEDYGYHFRGTKEADGKTYSVFLNGNDEEVALMRQEEGRVYLHLDENLRECLEYQKEGIENFDEIFGDAPVEILLYNFDAKVGDSYYIPVFFPNLEEFMLIPYFVIDIEDINISGEVMTFQSLSTNPDSDREPCVVVRGVGPDCGAFHRPQFGNLIPGMYYSYAFLKEMLAPGDVEIFTRNDFKGESRSVSPIEDFWMLEYEGDSDDGHFRYKMHFDGSVNVIGHQLYRVLYTSDATQTWLDNTKDIDNGLTFYLREEVGRVYILAPTVTEEDDHSPWANPTQEALLYDFNAQPGDEMTVVGSSGNLLQGKVTSTFSISINGHDRRAYTIHFDSLNSDHTVVEGLGNVSHGCFPYFPDNMSEKGEGWLEYLPAAYFSQELKRVTTSYGKVICEKDYEGYWPWERSDSAPALETVFPISFDGKNICADSEHITVYTPSGSAVVNGFSTLSIDGLQPGVYIAKAGTKTLKILVK